MKMLEYKKNIGNNLIYLIVLIFSILTFNVKADDRVNKEASFNDDVSNKSVDHLASFTMSCQTKREKGLWDFGGISAISHHDNFYYMMTEGNPYIYKTSLNEVFGNPSLVIEKKITISDGPMQQVMSKLEGMAACNNSFVIGSEGIPADDLETTIPQDIRLFMTGMDGNYIQELSLPDAFILDGSKKGAVPYRGIQGLSCSPNGKTLLVSLQLPLQQDGGPNIGPTRQILFAWDYKKQTFSPYKSVYIDVDKNIGIMGSEMINNEGYSLVLESEKIPGAYVYNHLYGVDMNAGESVNGCISLRKGGDCEKKYAAPKNLLLSNIERFSGQDLLAHEVQYDSISIGPKQKDGRHTIIVATDDDHCGSISNPMATEAPGFSGTTFSLFAVELE